MNSEKWNWDHLRYFLALANSGTLLAASRDLNVSHTTVSRRIKAFESSLQTKLFEHSSAGYRLTDAGSALLEQATQLKLSLDKVSRDIGGSDADIAGKVMIATTDSIAFGLMPPLLKELADRYPEVKISLSMGSKESNVQNREADIAIRTCKEPPDTLIGRHIGFVEFSACASPFYLQEHGITEFPDQTAEHRFIFLDTSFAGTPFYDWMAERVGPERCTVAVNNFLLAKVMCKASLGITVLPSYMLDDEPGLQKLPTREPIDRNSLWILSHSDLRDTARMRLVRQFLFESLAKCFSSNTSLAGGTQQLPSSTS